MRPTTNWLAVILLVLLVLQTRTLVFDCYSFSEDEEQPDELRSGERTFDLPFGQKAQKWLSPVVLVPGLCSSQLMAKLNKPSSPSSGICLRNSDWYNIWLNIASFNPLTFECLVDNLRLHWDNRTKTTRNTKGVEIIPKDFGSVEGTEYLAPFKMIGYFKTLLKHLEGKLNYKRGANIFGAPYDFRKAPNEMGETFENLTLLIESATKRNGDTPTTLICHSMGCLISTHLLNLHSDMWRKKYVRRLISLAAPWHGSLKALRALFKSETLGIPVPVSEIRYTFMSSTFPSVYYLFPRFPPPKNVGGLERVLVETEVANYTIFELDKLLEAAKKLDERDMLLEFRGLQANLTAPKVELWCLYGIGVKTTNKLSFEGNISSGKREDWLLRESHGDGDGTVNAQSLEACAEFAKQQTEPVYEFPFAGTNHIEIIRSQRTAKFIADEILIRDKPAKVGRPATGGSSPQAEGEDGADEYSDIVAADFVNTLPSCLARNSAYQSDA